MRHLPTYEEHLILNEENRLAAYYREHPDKVQKFGDMALPARSDEFGEWLERTYERQNPVKEKANEYREELKKWLESNGMAEQMRSIKTFGGRSDTYNVLWDYLIDSYSYRFETFEIYKLPWEKAKSDKAFKYVDQPALAWLAKNWDTIRDRLYRLRRLEYETKNWVQNRIAKEARMRGLTARDYDAAIGWIQRYTSSSRKQLPKEIWPALKSLTVDVNELPEYVYRGIFVDGAKVKDREKFLKKWKVGSMPGSSQGKATSWSSSKDVAAQFMVAQDFIKNEKEGFHVLFRWKVDPQYVIADLRNINGTFWNQQELIVDPAAKDYTIEAIFAPEPDKKHGESSADRFMDQNSSHNGGAWGMSRDEMMLRLFDNWDIDVPRNLKYEWKTMKDWTVGEVEDRCRTKIAGYTSWKNYSDQRKILFSLLVGLKGLSFRYRHVWPVSMSDPKTVDIEFFWNIESYGSDPIRDRMVKEIGPLNLPYSARIGGLCMFQMIQNDALNFKYAMTLPRDLVWDKKSVPKDDAQKEYMAKVTEWFDKNYTWIHSSTKAELEKDFNSRNKTAKLAVY